MGIKADLCCSKIARGRPNPGSRRNGEEDARSWCCGMRVYLCFGVLKRTALLERWCSGSVSAACLSVHLFASLPAGLAAWALPFSLASVYRTGRSLGCPKPLLDCFSRDWCSLRMPRDQEDASGTKLQCIP
ncbi:hypothetical protein GQ53DRAFT_228137 [Thozetella sp. PMI_491]|nr:hypothetical protein GQ53DRAFT_228137 [Thozetella sp. PMI_491]